MLTTALGLSLSRPASAALEAEVEGGVVAASRNDVRIPGAGGTDFSLVNDLSAPAGPAFRARVGVRFAERHLVTALYAPLRVSSSGEFSRDIDFAGESFAADTPVYGVYRFDSYRLTYRYSFLQRETFELAAGFTAKIRDAAISLHGSRTAEKTNTGFVPLVNLHFEWRPNAGPWGLLLDVDALAAPQGRAEDVLLAGTYRARDGVEAYAGYRTVEGGADNDEVYNFAWLHYGVLGLRFRL